MMYFDFQRLKTLFMFSMNVILFQDMPSQQVGVILPALYVTVTLSRALPSVQVLPDVRYGYSNNNISSHVDS